MQEEQRKKANLRMLQRYGPWTEIISTAAHVVLYEFQEGAWTKADTEGTLFFASPPSSLIILNRASADNFILNINSSLQIQDEEPYLILRVESKIFGLWFPNDEERKGMYGLVAESIGAMRQRPRAVSAPRSSLAEVGKLKAALGISGGTTTAVATVATNSATETPSVGMVQTTTNQLLATNIAIPLQQPLTTNTVIPLQQPLATNTVIPPQQPATLPQSAPEVHGVSEPLDKRSLQLALLSLIQDERFLDLIHAQYLRVAQHRQDKK